MGRKRPKADPGGLVAEFYRGDGGWSWEVRSSGRKLKRYFSSGFKSLSDAVEDFARVTEGWGR